MKDLFGGETNVSVKKHKKIHVATKVEQLRVKFDTKNIGLNSVYEDFGNYLINIRPNKTLTDDNTKTNNR